MRRDSEYHFRNREVHPCPFCVRLSCSWFCWAAAMARPVRARFATPSRSPSVWRSPRAKARASARRRAKAPRVATSGAGASAIATSPRRSARAKTKPGPTAALRARGEPRDATARASSSRRRDTAHADTSSIVRAGFRSRTLEARARDTAVTAARCSRRNVRAAMTAACSAVRVRLFIAARPRR